MRPDELVALDEALSELATLNPRLSLVVELRYFAGLSVEETAELLASCSHGQARLAEGACLSLPGGATIDEPGMSGPVRGERAFLTV
jgi:hypothetical protein